MRDGSTDCCDPSMTAADTTIAGTGRQPISCECKESSSGHAAPDRHARHVEAIQESADHGRRPDRAGSAVVPVRRSVRRLAVVRRGRVPAGLDDAGAHPAGAVPDRRHRRCRGRAGLAAAGLPFAPGVRTVGRGRSAQSVPDGGQHPAEDLLVLHLHHRGLDLRVLGAGGLADRAAVDARADLRADRPAVRPRRRLLRLRPAGAAVDPQLVVLGRRAQLLRRVGHPVPVRRPSAVRAGSAHHLTGLAPAVAADRPLRPGEGHPVLVRSL